MFPAIVVLKTQAAADGLEPLLQQIEKEPAPSHPLMQRRDVISASTTRLYDAHDMVSTFREVLKEPGFE